MNDVFLFVYWLRQLNGDGPGDSEGSAADHIALMRSHPAHLEDARSFWEHVWQTECRTSTQTLIHLLVHTARYLSDLVEGDLPILVPREVAEASVGVARPSQAEVLLIGKSIQRAIRQQWIDQSQIMTESILTEMQRLLSSRCAEVVPAESKYLDTRQIATRLNISEVTVARLCNRGLIDADKTQGNQWRTTDDRLRRSPYLNGRGRRGVRHAQLES